MSIQQPLLMVTGVVRDPHFANVVLLLHGNGANGGTTFTDTSSYTQVVGNAGSSGIVTSTAQSKFNGSSLLWTAASSPRLVVTAEPELAIGTADFTYEWWQYGAVTGAFFTDQPASGGNPPYGWMIYYNGAGYFQIIDSTGAGVSDWTFTPSAATWHHAAVQRISGVTSMYFDGVLKTKGGSANENRTLAYTTCTIGQPNTGAPGTTDALNGHTAEHRWTIGVGRYTAPFTPPTAAFPDS